MTDKSIEKLKEKLMAKKEKLKKEEQKQQVLDEMTHRTYTVFQDPEKKGRHFKMVKILYNPVTNKAIIDGIRFFEDKTAGLAIDRGVENLEYLYNKCKEGE